MELQEAVDAPRLHHQWLPDEVAFETRGLSPDTRARLAAMGYKLSEQTPWGAAAAIAVGQASGPAAASSGNDGALSGRMRAGFIYGSNDSRRPAGKAEGD